MDYSRSRSSFDLPKPDAGLAEWTSKIKEMQRQVDADEEAEQKRLEEEIAASRMRRMSRRRMTGNSTDLSKSPPFGAAGNDGPGSSTVSSPPDRQSDQADALRKLTGASRTVASPPPTAQASSSPPSRPTPAARSPPAVAPKPEPMSLAAFMGGRATGPRLNKHAPQQDAHDPTQFEQRTHISAPHPIFGRGGIALPGLAAKGRAPAPVVESPPAAETVRATSTVTTVASERERRISTPGGVAKRYTEKLEEVTGERLDAPQRTGSAPGVRERTVSTPSRSPARSPVIQPSPAEEFSRRPVSRSGSRPMSPAAPARTETPPTAQPAYLRSPVSPSTAPQRRSRSPVSFQPASATPPPASPPSTQRPYTPLQRAVSPSVSSPPSSKSPVTTPSLARPIAPTPKSALQGPQMPPSKTPSAAFLKAQTPKEPTPSLTRLKGRGFVQNMVKASSQLESSVSEFGAPQKGRTGGEKRTSILDRWQPQAGPPSASPPSSPSKPIPMRKSKTIDPSDEFTKRISKPEEPPRQLKSVASLPSVAASTEPMQATVGASPDSRGRTPVPEVAKQPEVRGLGSSSTMISYIKPHKTGDDAQSPPHGKQEKAPSRASGTGAFPTPSHAPLSHPTKDRARRARKGHDSRTTAASAGNQDFEDQQSAKVSPFNPASTLATPPTTLPRATSPPREPSSSVEPPASASGLERKPATGRITDRWQDQTIIGVKQTNTYRAPESVASTTHKQDLNGIRRALPGLTSPNVPPFSQDRPHEVPLPPRDFLEPASTEEDVFSLPTTPPLQVPEEKTTLSQPSTPTRHARIPSTGNRATVMDVAQAMSEQQVMPVSPQRQDGSPIPEAVAEPPRSPVTPRTNRLTTPQTAQAQAERRKSSYEKYSAIILPSLKEEKTPASSPANTLARSAAPELGAFDDSTFRPSPKTRVSNLAPLPQEEVPKKDVDRNENSVHIPHKDSPLPSVDVDSLLKTSQTAFTPDANIEVISADVLAISGNNASAVSKDPHIFYDTEVLAIVYRSKSKSSGLVSTKVWGWRGKKSQVGDKEERKLQEIAQRYGSTLEIVQQFSEPLEMVHILGGLLATRQGTRQHWSPENTAMHVVRSYSGHTTIDELNLDVKSLCSGFSFCLTILDTIYLWNGRGSTADERRIARAYADSIASSNVISMNEGENDDDEMFWMMLGDADYARADYWSWKKGSTYSIPTVLKVDEASTVSIVADTSLSKETDLNESVYILNCHWELFVLVGKEARGQRNAIRLALSIAMDISSRTESSRPFTPPVHVLILPTRLPVDLLAHFRDLDEWFLNGGYVPDHMNVLTSGESLQHLHTSSWDRNALMNVNMLPLGIHPSQVSSQT